MSSGIYRGGSNPPRNSEFVKIGTDSVEIRDRASGSQTIRVE